MANKANTKPSTQQYLEIAEIHDDVAVLKDGSLRAVLLVSSVNFALKSEKEKDGIIYGFQNFLNYLNFDIQIIVRSRKLDLKDYLKTIQEKARKQTNENLQSQTVHYIAFIEDLLQKVDIMKKQFFVVVPYYANVVQNTGKLLDKLKNSVNPVAPAGMKPSNFEENRLQLMQRVDVITSQLSSMGLRCVSLDTQELIELYYTSYNPDSAQNQKLTNIENITNSIIQKGEEIEEDTLSLDEPRVDENEIIEKRTPKWSNGGR